MPALPASEVPVSANILQASFPCLYSGCRGKYSEVYLDNCFLILLVSDCKEGKRKEGRKEKKEDSLKSPSFTQETCGRTG